MEYTYEIPLDREGNPREDVVIRLEDNAYIPTDPANKDYQAYLKSLKDVAE